MFFSTRLPWLMQNRQDSELPKAGNLRGYIYSRNHSGKVMRASVKVGATTSPNIELVVINAQSFRIFRVKARREKMEAVKQRAAEAAANNNVELEHQRRVAAINKVFGLWRNRTDTPKDGLAYQEESRAE